MCVGSAVGDDKMSLNSSKLLRVASFEYYPYQSFSSPGLNVPIKGFNGHVIRAICQSLLLSYEVIESQAWGLQKDDGTWTGAMGRLERDEADMTLCPTNPTHAKLLVAEQTYPLHPIELLILNGRISRLEQNTFGILLTFEGSVWIALVVGLLVMTLLMTLWHATISTVSPEVRYRGFVRSCDVYGFMLMENVFNEGTAHPPPDRNSIRLLWMSWYLGITLVLMNAFAGQLKASMMFKPEKPRIENLLDLYHSKHAVYFAKDSAGESALKHHPSPHVQKMYERTLIDKTYGSAERIIQNDILELVVQERASIITSRPAEAMVSEAKCATMDRGEFYISERPVRIFNAVYHLNYRLDAQLRSHIQTRIQWMADSGLLNRWWKEIAGEWNGCSRGDPLELDALSLTDFESIAYLWLLGLAFALVAFGLEKTPPGCGCCYIQRFWSGFGHCCCGCTRNDPATLLTQKNTTE